ncbi:cis-Golgi t-SNARE syntaxin [Quaeritorhiza haematococci]|nr:cis-Golgi t-SNARE syntaxin [Quaeritorhiza haematococci]
MTIKDRTNEFQAAVESLLNRGGPVAAPAEKARLLGSSGGGGSSSSSLLGGGSNSPSLSKKSEFAKAAAQIGREINTTMLKLQKLTRLAKKKSLFDDRPVEINELIFVIKQDIAKINKNISTLQTHLNTNKAKGTLGNRQMEEHSSNVITSLQSKLASTSNEFRNILEIRTQNMKEQKSRRDQYTLPASTTGAGSSGPVASSSGAPPLQHTSSFGNLMMASPPRSDSPLYHPERRPGSTSDLRQRSNSNGPSSSDLILDIESGGDSGGGAGGGFGGFLASGQQSNQLMQMQNPGVNMEIIESRAQAIESIEATIAELGQIYTHFAQLLAGQREAVQRIDDNVVDVEINVTRAHNELLKYFQSISSNRWLMIKIFSVIVFFFLVFVVFLQ